MGNICVNFKSVATNKVCMTSSLRLQGVHFTTAEISLLQKQWSRVSINMIENGRALFARIFAYSDELMSKFSFAVANNMEMEKTLKDARLIAHIHRVFSIISRLIDSLPDPDKYKEARLHVQMAGARHNTTGLKKKHLLIFKEIFGDCLRDILQDTFTDNAEQAWMKLVDDIAVQMLKGIQCDSGDSLKIKPWR